MEYIVFDGWGQNGNSFSKLSGFINYISTKLKKTTKFFSNNHTWGYLCIIPASNICWYRFFIIFRWENNETKEIYKNKKENSVDEGKINFFILFFSNRIQYYLNTFCCYHKLSFNKKLEEKLKTFPKHGTQGDLIFTVVWNNFLL